MQETNKICPNCLNKVNDDDLMCPHCNSLILDNPEDSKKYICPICGAENPQGQKSCLYCCSVFPETFA